MLLNNCVLFGIFLSTYHPFCVLGDYENCVKHLTNAIAVCGQPQQLLQVFQQMLPPAVFQILLQNISKIGSSPQVCISTNSFQLITQKYIKIKN